MFAVAALALGGLSACGGSNSVDAKACGHALDAYHLALTASDVDGNGPNLTDLEEASHQNAVVKNCDEPTFSALLSGDGYDYTKGADAVAGGPADKVFTAFCDGAAKPNHC